MKIYLDLLPQQRKNELKRKKMFGVIFYEEFIFIIPIVVLIVILLSIYYVLTIERNISAIAHSSVQSQDEYQQLSTYEEKFKQINGVTQKLTKIQASHLHWENFFQQFSEVTPDGISMSSLATKDFKVFLAGKAKTRENLLQFKSKLESSQCFSDVNVPLSNLVVRDDVDFQIDFAITEDCLKK